MINYKYFITLKVIDTNGTVYTYSDRIAFLTIFDDYEKSINSAIKIGFFVKPEVYNILNLRSTKMRYYLSVRANAVSSYQQIETSYNIMYLDNFKIKPMTTLNTIYKSDNNESNNKQNDHIQVVMDFIPENVLIYNRYMCNGVYSNVTVNDVILYLLNKMNTPVLYEEPDNHKKYDQIILPPNNLFMSLKFLHQHYGIYNNGMSMWFKGNVFCLKNKYNNVNTPKIKDTHVNDVRIFVSKDVHENVNIYGGGTLYDSRLNMYEYTTGSEKILIDNNIITLEELYGNKHMIYSRNLNETYVIDASINYKQNADKLKVYWNGIENPTAIHQYFNQLRNSISITVSYDNCDLNMWSPINRCRFHISTNDILFDKYVYNYFQVARNEMFFTVRGGVASLQGKATLIDIGGIAGDDQEMKIIEDQEGGI